MDNTKNKKVIISMVVAVSFLVLLIMSATYAYFQANNTAAGTTNLDASTTELPIVTVVNPTEQLHLRLTAYEMQENKQNTSYWATKEYSTSGTLYSSTAEWNTIAILNMNGDVCSEVPEYNEDRGEYSYYTMCYNCCFYINVTKPEGIKEGDMTFSIRGMSDSYDEDLFLAHSSYSFCTDFNTGGEVKAAISLNNTTSSQNHLIDKDLTTIFSISNLSCHYSMK